MAILRLAAEPREDVGSRAAARLREAGYIPANLYSKGQPSTLLKLEASSWSKHLTDQLNLVRLEFPDGGDQVVALKEIQRDPMTQEVIHVDFLGVKMDEAVEFHVLVKFEGTPEGVKEGGVRTISSEYVMVECLPTDVPDSIPIDISHLKIGDSVTAGQLQLPENVKLVSDPAVVLASVATVRVVEEAAPVAEEAEVAEGEEAEEKKAAEEAEGEHKERGDSKEKD